MAGGTPVGYSQAWPRIRTWATVKRAEEVSKIVRHQDGKLGNL